MADRRGYQSSDRKVTDLANPPSGPAPTMADRPEVPQPRTDAERVDWIIESLIADKHYAIYQRDEEFHTAVEVMARGLLPFMDVLADQARERQAEMARLALLLEAHGG